MSKHLALERNLCFIEVIEGETDGLERQVGEAHLFEALHRSGVHVRSIDINAAGCFLTIDSDGVRQVKAAARLLNVAVRVHDLCSRIVLQREAQGPVLPALPTGIGAFHDEQLAIVDIAADPERLCVLVASADAHSAMAILNRVSKAAAHRAAA